MQRFRVGVMVLAPAFLLAAFLWLLQPVQQLDAQGSITNFNNVTLSGDLVAGGDATVGGNLSVSGVLAAASYITGEEDVILPAAVSIVTDASIGDDLAVTGDTDLTGNLVVTGTSTLIGAVDAQGGIADSGGVLTIADSAIVDGAADTVQLTVQGHSTNNSMLFVVENSAGTDQFSVGNTGDAIVTDDLSVTDDLTANDLTVADFVNITAQGVITLETGSVLTPTGSLQPVLSVAAAFVNGPDIVHTSDYLVLVNIGAQTVTFTETTGLISAGDIALGAGDASTLVWANGGWIEIARSNN